VALDHLRLLHSFYITCRKTELYCDMVVDTLIVVGSGEFAARPWSLSFIVDLEKRNWTDEDLPRYEDSSRDRFVRLGKREK